MYQIIEALSFIKYLHEHIIKSYCDIIYYVINKIINLIYNLYLSISNFLKHFIIKNNIITKTNK